MGNYYRNALICISSLHILSEGDALFDNQCNLSFPFAYAMLLLLNQSYGLVMIQAAQPHA